METAAEWISALLELRDLKQVAAEAIIQLGRLTEDRTRDISPDVRKRAVERLKAEGVIDEPRLHALAEFITPGRSDVSLTFGESLPKGLHLESTADCLSPVSAIATED